MTKKKLKTPKLLKHGVWTYKEKASKDYTVVIHTILSQDKVGVFLFVFNWQHSNIFQMENSFSHHHKPSSHNYTEQYTYKVRNFPLGAEKLFGDNRLSAWVVRLNKRPF